MTWWGTYAQIFRGVSFRYKKKKKKKNQKGLKGVLMCSKWFRESGGLCRAFLFALFTSCQGKFFLNMYLFIIFF